MSTTTSSLRDWVTAYFVSCFEALFCCTYTHRLHGTTPPPSKCHSLQLQLLTITTEGETVCAGQGNPGQWELHWSGLSPQLSLHPPRPKFPLGGICFDRQRANINFYLCGFQVTLSGKVYWSFNLPEMAARLNNHFLLAQLRNLKRAVVAKECEDTLPPASAVLSCMHQCHLLHTLGSNKFGKHLSSKSHADSLERQASATFYSSPAVSLCLCIPSSCKRP